MISTVDDMGDIGTCAEEPPRAPPRTRISHDEYHQFCDETLECMTACLCGDLACRDAFSVA